MVAVHILLLPLALVIDTVALPRRGVPPLGVVVVLRWAILGIGWVPFLLLSFWCGLGTSSIARRIVGGTLGAAYLAGVWMYWERVMVPWSLRPLVIFAREPLAEKRACLRMSA